MATRPTRNTSSKRNKSTPKTQTEINRIKPSGALSLDVLQKKSKRVISINVKLPDGEIYQFYHLPMTTGAGEEFVSIATDVSQLAALRSLLAELLVNSDGEPFADEEFWKEIDIQILRKIHEAILESAKEEGGED